jgi:ATP-dependent phosphofructokinase / diphosphate-dependent phosphofructokinase
MKTLIGQAGGPTADINQSLVGAILEAQAQDHELIGGRNGVNGIMREDFVDLMGVPQKKLEAIANTPSAALGSTRDKPTDEYCRKIVEVLQKNNFEALLYIGGNDSSETIRLVVEYAKKVGFSLKGFHIPKTVDNDLMENDHTPGWPSAARFVAKAMMGIDRDNASLPGVHIVTIMGRHAGFLTCAASLITKPHLTYIPEHPFDLAEFTAEVESAFKNHGRCVIAVSEGIQNENGTSIAQQLTGSNETDPHGNAHLSSLPLGDALVQHLKDETDIPRIRQDSLGYMQRSFPDPSPVDQQEARDCGKKAIELLSSDRQTGSIVVLRDKIDVVDLEKVANLTRLLPKEMYNVSSKQVTQAFLDYALPLVGDLPQIATL